ncbi:phosphonate ABC transporter, permease protein PhnE [Xenophilus arseniciresistens]|uniref:Phosphonate ABC transporter, permease protein PhnE n=1 Tax=Xenophilus arseniciresistens TaxID=1283306 RepID=A0AAE3N8P3_9BURK|nr:phosphonate ABC transporter, permease protein PhnE [Xenophilus arseniciresistens]MDA7417700.1 phosphonate ABC transporter, permease protein PhnE [Xenophilus arseniciresistens]
MRQRAESERPGLLTYVAWGAVLGLLAWAWRGAEIRPLDLIRDSGNIGTLARDFFPPDFRDWRIYGKEMLVTIHIAIWGTLLAVVAAVPAGLLCASNVAPAWVHQPMRRLMDACRAINEMVFAMLFIVAVGLGPFAGVLALAIHTTGTLAKLFSESVEAIDPRPVEGIRATGAHRLVEVIHGVIPQVLPLWLSFTLYRFESNVRSASVVGMVGAGGIGVVLYEVIRSFQYGQTAAVLLILVVTVSLIDLVSAKVRKRFI